MDNLEDAVSSIALFSMAVTSCVTTMLNGTCSNENQRQNTPLRKADHPVVRATPLLDVQLHVDALRRWKCWERPCLRIFYVHGWQILLKSTPGTMRITKYHFLLGCNTRSKFPMESAYNFNFKHQNGNVLDHSIPSAISAKSSPTLGYNKPPILLPSLSL